MVVLAKPAEPDQWGGGWGVGPGTIIKPTITAPPATASLPRPPRDAHCLTSLTWWREQRACKTGPSFPWAPLGLGLGMKQECVLRIHLGGSPSRGIGQNIEPLSFRHCSLEWKCPGRGHGDAAEMHLSYTSFEGKEGLGSAKCQSWLYPSRICSEGPWAGGSSGFSGAVMVETPP